MTDSECTPAPLAAHGRAVDMAFKKVAIREVVADMQQAWNCGDYRGYIQGVLDPGLVLVSRGRFQKD
ncbi:MAG TPA: hypothetical protein DDZ67_13985 [Xanthomonadaceae bacterium]|nr:hypothetical protein [Xanthomonadaceae bacterium]